MKIFGMTSKTTTAVRKDADEKFAKESQRLAEMAAKRAAVREQLSLAMKQIIEDRKSDAYNH